jgi:hypothetical protein
MQDSAGFGVEEVAALLALTREPLFSATLAKDGEAASVAAESHFNSTPESPSKDCSVLSPDRLPDQSSW